MTNVLTVSPLATAKRARHTSAGSSVTLNARSSRQNTWLISGSLNQRGGISSGTLGAAWPRAKRAKNRGYRAAISPSAIESNFSSWLLNETKKIDWETFGG